VHRGVKWWKPELREKDFPNVAASIQKITEDYLVSLAKWAKKTTGKNNLVMMGGVALNCVANTKIAEMSGFDDFWIMPNPGDAGSSIGAVAAYTRRGIDFNTPYLGYDINRPLDVSSVVDCLLDGEIVGIANGRAEFGPRALGNRSLICDPRGDAKDRVNAIKKREPFRPFAPIIIEHLAEQYFDMPVGVSPYMQYVAKVKDPDKFPAITHFDGTARVQTLRREQNPKFYSLLEAWYSKTGCPMLLNTSLNIKGQPLVNTWDDALEFSMQYGVKVF
jgi:carbamoyltransferase